MSELHWAAGLFGLSVAALGSGGAVLTAWTAARMWRHDVMMAMFGLLLAVVMLGATGVCLALLRMVAP